MELVYNGLMKIEVSKTCSTSRVSKYIRIALSLAIIGVGILTKNWLGLIGVLTLISAFTGGGCPLTIRFNRRSGFHLKE